MCFQLSLKKINKKNNVRNKKEAGIVRRVGFFSCLDLHFCVENQPEYIQLLQEIQELMPNLGLEMLFMLNEASQIKSLNS